MKDCSDRFVALEGGHNFRDIGGYSTADGQMVARGLVYRSGTMSELTDGDHAVLEDLGLQLVCDFRSTGERTRRPSRFSSIPSFEIWCRDYDLSGGDLLMAMRHPNADANSSRRLMIETYRTLVYEQAPSYAELFRRIASGPLPLVFHCSAGKDRTGIAAALLLDLLGVSRQDIVDDYLLSDLFFARGCELVAKDPLGDQLSTIAKEVWEPVMRADADYIQAMFETMETRHGSTTQFLREELGLTDDIIELVRARLLN